MAEPTPADRIRALTLLEAANHLRDAHFQKGMSVQEIGTALRNTADEADPMVGSLARDGFGLDEIAAMLSGDEPEGDLATARETNRRLNYEKQQLQSELAAYRRAVGQWEVSERGTYISHASLRTIGLACGKDILGSVRHLKHFERVEQAEAAIDRGRQLALAFELSGNEFIADQIRTTLDLNEPATSPSPPADTDLRDRIAAAIIASDGVPSFEFAAKLHRVAALREADAVLAVLLAPVETAAVLLARAESYLSALHGSVARHDNLGENFACAGCELRDQITAELRRRADEQQADDEGMSGPCDCGEGAIHYTTAECPFEQRRTADEAQRAETVSPAYARLQAVAKEATEAAHLHAMHGMKRAFQLARQYGNQPIPPAEVLNALGLDENANTVEPVAPAPAPDPTWPRRAWDLGLLHTGGEPHHCPACLAQPEPPAGFICPNDNEAVLANPQPPQS